ncbi:hypothetical protein EST38_g7352 [Candolleomyces aberdarensis]|uniref:6-phosphogluconate dehydrogenase NADP-binding domain-containing protein n=1 Tax=Candolleomyces aberdarensis TaxID=2316362 RepID=A0A4Q2DFC5_9AGAR|nr:hypothetical protein EST38_g7352 [Candolleomyces aberdarensis]
MANPLSPPILTEQPSFPFSRPATPGPLDHRQVGFVGLGNIGYAMAKNLAQNGPQNVSNLKPPKVWNRTISKSEKLVQQVGKDKASIAGSPEEIALECDIIIVNLANDDVVRSVYSRFAEALKSSPPTKKKIFVETSTIYPSLAGDLDKFLCSFPHTHLITCPVLGSAVVADKSQLTLIMSGDYPSKKEVANLLVPSVGRKVLDLGGDLEKALTYKLMANSMVLGTMEILAEALTFAEKSGIGGERVLDLVKDFFPAPSMVNYAERMAHEKFDGNTGFAIDGGIKDATHIRRLSAKYNCPMPAIDVAHQHLITARAIHLKEKNEGKEVASTLDWSGIIAGTRAGAGLDGFDRNKDATVVEI